MHGESAPSVLPLQDYENLQGFMQEMDNFQGFPATSTGHDLQSHRYEGFENGDDDSDEDSDPFGAVRLPCCLPPFTVLLR